MSDSQSPLEEGLPRHFGRYRLLSLLGQGGMAAVYLAELSGPDGFSRKLALKRVHTHLGARSSFRQLFLREARLGGLLHHPNIIQTLDYGLVEGQPYLALELVEGVSLETVLTFHRTQGELIPDGALLSLGIQLCRGLAYAHTLTDEQGQPLQLVHRDIKPSNVLLSRFGEARLADFGIARADIGLDITQESGVIKGTTLYMSPEQALGEASLDHRSDLFSLGLLLFELYTLQPFHEATSPLVGLQRAQNPDVEARLMRLPPGPLTEGLREVLRVLLARVPEERTPHAQVLAHQLQRLERRLEEPFDFTSWCERVVRACQGTNEAASRSKSEQVRLEQTFPEDTPEARARETFSVEGDETGALTAGQALKSELIYNVEEELKQHTSLHSSTHVQPKIPSSQELEPTPRARFVSLRRFGGLLLGLLVLLLLRASGLLTSLDTMRQDVYAWSLLPTPPTHKVMIVDLSDEVEPWPWQRGTHARLVERLIQEAQVAQVVMDVVLSARSAEPRETREVAEQRLAALQAQTGKLVLGLGGFLQAETTGPMPVYRLSADEPMPLLLREVPRGFAALLAPGKRGGPVRRAALYAEPLQAEGPPLELSLVGRAVAGTQPPQPDRGHRRIKLGEHWISTDGLFAVELPPTRPEDFPMVSAAQLLGEGPLSPVLVERLRGRHVVLGRSSDPYLDRVATPWGYRPGVVVQATLLAELLEGRSRYRGGLGLELGVLGVLGGLGISAWQVQEQRRRVKRLVQVWAVVWGLEVMLIRGLGMWLGAPVVEVGVLLGLAWLRPRRG
ncbi:MAG: protein kinase domain-containing protein [Myxococcota bacterium]